MSDEYDDNDDYEEAEEAPKKKTAKRAPKEKAAKDPAKPKGALSAYMFFAKSVRPPILEQNPGLSVPETAKIIGAKWKELTDEDKEPFNLLAAQDKSRHQSEMAGYTPPAAAAGKKGKAAKAEKGGKVKKAKRAKKEKDPNAPKRPATAYFLYANTRRADIKKEHSDWGVAEIAKHMGAEWRNLSDEEKKPFVDEAAKKKAQYDSAKKAYVSGKGEAAAEDDEEEEEEDEEDDE